MTICSSAFAAMGRAQAAKLGFARLPIAVIAHPFGLRTREEVSRMAQGVVDEIVKLAEGTK
ncbi:MAG TPA: hypothetical protein VGI14_02235 [Casimicrobiaceae bacterium]